MTSRQTISFLQKRFREVGLQPDRRHGQNFLIDLNLVDLLVRAADLGPDDVVLEVGTGTGSLTARMAQLAAAVVTVEIDQHLQILAREELIDCDNVVMLQQDALRNKNNIHPAVLEAVRAELAKSPTRRFKLAANLPYNIATPLLSNLLTTDIVPESMTVTIQKELADRIVAPPSTKDYSALSIWMQALCDSEIVRLMPPEVFWPRPKVDSAIIHIVPNPAKRALVPDLRYFHTLVRSLFFHRRKFLRSVLVSAYKERLEKSDIDAVFVEMGFGPNTRAETLEVPTLLKLCEILRERERVVTGRTAAALPDDSETDPDPVDADESVDEAIDPTDE